MIWLLAIGIDGEIYVDDSHKKSKITSKSQLTVPNC